ncbi:DUF2243 domain-containing protein [Gilvimarinus sp. F26214L]|uniref:DUF2243 domain-containing protein n=1 Tax=Gilvimarinus sp. DZF01 TaxID=3461371 RepID=UPI004045A4A8
MSRNGTRTPEQTQSLWAGLLVGVGLMAGVDEIIFHQILAWHHFYDRSTGAIALMSDGLLHAAELVVIVAGFVLLLNIRKRGMLVGQWAWPALLIGAGIFQVFDGIVDHKILRTHQIRYGVDNLIVYDLVWNAFGVVLLATGLWMLRRNRQRVKAVSAP